MSGQVYSIHSDLLFPFKPTSRYGPFGEGKYISDLIYILKYITFLK